MFWGAGTHFFCARRGCGPEEDPKGLLSGQAPPFTASNRITVSQGEGSSGLLCEQTMEYGIHPPPPSSKYQNNPGLQHIKAALRILAYLKWNPDWGILYKKTGKRYGESWDIELYVDSDHAADMDHRRSRTGFIILVNGTNMIDFGTAFGQCVIILKASENSIPHMLQLYKTSNCLATTMQTNNLIYVFNDI